MMYYKHFIIEELEHFKNKIKNEIILNEEMFADIDDLGVLLVKIDRIYEKQVRNLKGDKECTRKE